MTRRMISAHFSLDEFACRCGRGHSQIEPPRALIDGLEKLRELLGGRPIIITSGHRCEEHNAEVGGVPRSSHLAARAADIVVRGVRPSEIATLVKFCVPTLRALPYDRKGYTHIDLRDI